MGKDPRLCRAESPTATARRRCHHRRVVDPDTYRSLAEASWRWVLAQVRGKGSDLWLPENPAQGAPGDYPYGMHSGVGGLAHVISEIRLSRDLTPDELALGEGIAATLVRRIPDTTEYDYFDGLVSTIGVLAALGAPDPSSRSPGCWTWGQSTAGSRPGWNPAAPCRTGAATT